MRVAIICTGLDHTRRGFETFSSGLFSALSGHIDVTLFKGSGRREPGQVVVPCLRRNGFSEKSYLLEQRTFAISVFPRLLLGHFDLVHYSDHALGSALWHLRRWTGARIPLLFSNGGPSYPWWFKPDTYIHQVAPTYYDAACRSGIAPGRMHLVPYGIKIEDFVSLDSKSSARAKFGIPMDATVVLSAAALKLTHKRLDYLVKELAALKESNYFLCMAGERTDETVQLEALASDILHGRHLFLTLDRREMPTLFSAADIFVHPALFEGFGLVLIEAMAAGLPVIAHNSDHFRWLLDEAAIFIDMTSAGALSSVLRELSSDMIANEELRRKCYERVQAFDWQTLAPQYIAMYEAVVAANKSSVAANAEE
jgi:1,2-diacylglycerol 3-alpha-glucosyltransferase